MILFNASEVGLLMVEPKEKIKKEKGELSETAKAYVKKVFLRNTYGYKEVVLTDGMLKGNEVEQAIIDMAQKKLGGELRITYKKLIQNDFVKGIPDIYTKSFIEDTKASENLKTFMDADFSPLYYGQAQSYMWITNVKKFRLIYGLVKTPQRIIDSQILRYYYKFDCNEDDPNYIKICNQIEHNNNVIDTIPIDKRLKIFETDYDSEYIEKLERKIIKAREYYDTLSL